MASNGTLATGIVSGAARPTPPNWGTSLRVAASVALVMTASQAYSQSLECAAVSSGGGITSNGSLLVVGQAAVGTMSNASFTIEVGIIACLTGPGQCALDSDCDDADDCTTDVCDPGDPSADAFGCVNTCTPKLFADIVPLFCPPTCPQPDIDDILCTIDGFGAGPNWPDICPDGDLSPCAPNGDGILNIDDILKVIDAFGGNPGCPDPCTCP